MCTINVADSACLLYSAIGLFRDCLNGIYHHISEVSNIAHSRWMIGRIQTYYSTSQYSDSFSWGSYGQPYTRTSLRGPIISQAYYGIPLLKSLSRKPSKSVVTRIPWWGSHNKSPRIAKFVTFHIFSTTTT